MCSDNDGGRAASTSLSFRESSVAEGMAMAFLPDEFFKQRNKTLTIVFGKPIPYQTFDRRYTDAQWAEKLRCFSYCLAQDKDLVFDPDKDYQIP